MSEVKIKKKLKSQYFFLVGPDFIASEGSLTKEYTECRLIWHLRMCRGYERFFAIIDLSHSYFTTIRPIAYAKNRCAATCIRATVTPNRSLFGKPPGTSLKGFTASVLEC